MRMADLKYQAVRHNHAEFLAKAKQRPGFTEVYEELAFVYAQAHQVFMGSAKESSDEEKHF